MSKYQLGTFLLHGVETPIVHLDGAVYTLADVLEGAESVPASVLALLDSWDRWREILPAAVRDFDRAKATPIDLATGAFRPPVTTPRKIICVGVNYHDHIEEMKVGKLPDFPYAFLRPATSLAGHGADVPLPDGPKMIDWEAELGIVIGRRVRHAKGEQALAAIAGYTVVNDLSARDWIENRPFVGIDWVMQKAWDAFQPTGPWLTPAAFVPDPQNLAIELTVNGVVKQRSNTQRMIFGVREIVEHLSAIMTLEPGDMIPTGTPAGVGFGRDPRESLGTGDIVRVTVEGLGTLQNRMV
jgi:2-keto-4-pentenoate hydratase/2-oxohepta-3-ene-1,7-dioic acid hydratase in catechol pathway